MENLIIYLAKAGGLMAMFYVAYYLLLRKETFFRSNRIFLIAGLLTSAILPLLVYTKIIWVNPAPAPSLQPIHFSQLAQAITAHKAAVPVKEMPAEINWFTIAAGMYFAGVLFFLVRFAADLFSVIKIIKGNTIIKEGKFWLTDTRKITSPFSFFNYIVYNSAILSKEELQSILSHEKVHSRQLHSLDMLFGQLFCAFFWFNPVIWLYKKAISQNLEFIADANAVKLLNSKTAYQKTLLKITIQPGCIAITNHFYQSLIKKRIVMLNKTKSKKINAVRYAFILPALFGFIMLFQVKVVAQERKALQSETTQNTKIAVEITKDSKDTEIAAETKILKEKFDTDVTLSNITRNTKSEITAIKVAVKDKTQSKIYEVSGTEPIKPFTIEVEKSSNAATNTITFGLPATTGEGFSIYAVGEEEEDSDDDRVIALQGRPLPHPRPAPRPAPMPPLSINSPALNFNNTDAALIINGVKQPKGSTLQLQPGEQINNITLLDNKDAKKKYGKDAKKGAIEITTRKNTEAFAFVMPEMDMEEVMDYARIGMNIGFDTMANLDIQKELNMSLEGLKSIDFKMFSPQEMAGFQDDLEQAQRDIQNAGLDIQKHFREQRLSKEEMSEAQKEIEAARKEIEAAKKEIQKAKQEIQKAQQQAKKAAASRKA